MKSVRFQISFAVLLGALSLAGCESDSQSHPGNASEANAALAAPYRPGTGVSGNSFERRPRFYTAPNSADAQGPTTQSIRP
jgi:hypothetical protein